ncbi:MAG: hypothetical protein HKN25_08570 [Pyrinomonadaceae bacterium]|nr:hypothetical protein [Pyrinomonadaceae bacterium]
MKFLRLAFVLVFIGSFSIVGEAQLRSRKSAKSTPVPIRTAIRHSPAFAELILRRAELESSLAELLVSYKEEFPKVKETRYELDVIRADIKEISSTSASQTGKLTLSLGKLLVRRAELATDYWVLKNRYSDQHPSTKKSKRKLEIFERAIKEII